MTEPGISIAEANLPLEFVQAEPSGPLGELAHELGVIGADELVRVAR